MRWVLRVKLAMHWRKFGDLLFATRELPIVENSRKDSFWGAIPEPDDRLVGKNVLGRLLMELREELQRPEKEALQTVFPPEIDNFTLLAKPIGVISFKPVFGTSGADPDMLPTADGLWRTVFDESAPPIPTKTSTTLATMGTPERMEKSSSSAYPKRLIEVDLPIRRISAHARREKSIRHGHISTLHIWWARRPLAACRAVICASLWPDPADPLCPEAFRAKAREEMLVWASHERQVRLSAESRGRFEQARQNPGVFDDALQLRGALLDFIADFANWDNSTVREFLDTSRALTQAAHEALGGAPGTRPLVVDPFAGGGSIPLEALRVGADAFASDLNPIPVLLNKVVLEYIPKYGQRLADEVRKWGAWIKEEAEKELAQFYPNRYLVPDEVKKQPVLLIKAKPGNIGCVTHARIPDAFEGLPDYTHYLHITADEAHGPTAMSVAWNSELSRLNAEQLEKRVAELGFKPLRLLEETPVAYLWARTIQCEGPGCGAEVPLIRSLWLAKKANHSVALQILPKPKAKRVDFQLIVKQREGWVEQGNPKVRIEAPKFEGTVKRGSATCPCCGFTTPVARVRAQFKERHGGANDARLMCVVTTQENEQGRSFRLPTGGDAKIIEKANTLLQQQLEAHTGLLSLIPDEPTPQGGGSGAGRAFSQRNYGMERFSDLFTSRQLLSLSTLIRVVKIAGEQMRGHGDDALANAAQTVLALGVSRIADIANSLCSWKASMTQAIHLFTRQAIPMVWDFAETSLLSNAAGDYGTTIGNMIRILEHESGSLSSGHIEPASAAMHPLPDDAADCFCTDPPYYDAVPYSDLSDFFYVWLKRGLPLEVAFAFANNLTPKKDECIVDEVKGKDAAYFEATMRQAMTEGRRILAPNGIGIVVFAHKSTTGWEAQLQAMVDAGWIMTGSWPIDTEMGNRLRAMDSAALASSVHLVCRPRETPDRSVCIDDVGDWRDVLTELPRRIHEWMPRLAEEGVVGADAIFACLGPALEIFSRYSRVEKASGEEVSLREYLEQVWGAVAKEALAMVFQGADTTGFEADARLTAMWLWTLNAGAAESTGGGDDTDEDSDEESEIGGKKGKSGGFVLEYDAARKIAQGLGAHLEDLGSLVEVSGETARLLPVGERARHLFGKTEGRLSPQRKKREPQMDLFKVLEAASEGETAFGETKVERHGETVLDRIHQSMILFAASRGEALKRFLVEDGAGRDQRFWRLAQALSALYPIHTEEKRWVDGVLARKKGLGF